MTQRLCRAVVEALARRAEEQPTQQTDELEGMALVDRECERLFLNRAAQETDDNLTFVRSRLLRGEADVASLLDLYLQVCKGRRVRDDETNPLCGVLRLSGITMAQRGLLRPRNRIYSQVFDRAWALANLPDAETRRQKRAYRRGLLRAASVFGSMAGLTAILLGAAVVNAARARDSAARARSAEKRAETQGERANAQAGEARRLLYFSDLGLIQSEWENSNLEHVQALLDETRHLPQRGWEWNYWNRVAHRPALTIALGGRPALAQFSPDNHLAIADGFLPLTAYDLRTGARKSYRAAGWTGGQPVDYAPDGSRLWTCTDDGAIQDALTGRIFARPAPGSPHFATVCALRDGSGLLTCDNNGTLCLWSLAMQRRVWQRMPKPPLDIAPLIVGSTLMLALDRQQNWHLYWLRDGVENHAFDAELKLFASSALAFSSDDGMLAGEGRGGGIVLLDLHTGKISLPLGAERTLKAIRFGPNDKTLIAAFWGNVQVWNWRAKRECAVYKVNRGMLASYAISPDGRYVATGDGNSEKIGDLNAPGEAGTIEASPRALWQTSYSPDGRVVAAGGSDGNVYRYDAQSGLALPVLKGNGIRVNRAAYSHNGRWIASAREDGGVWVWDARTGRRLAAFRAHAKRVETLCFSRDDRTLLTASDDCLAKLWDVEAQEETKKETRGETNEKTDKTTPGRGNT